MLSAEPSLSTVLPLRPLRIVMITHSHKLGGMERHVLGLMQALQSLGHVLAYAGPLDGWLGEQVIAAGLPHCHVPLHGMYDPLSALRLYRYARHFGADLIHGHSQRGARYASVIGGWAGVGRVATAHSTNSYRWFTPQLQVIAVAQSVREFLVGIGLPAKRVHCVHSGVDDQASAPAARRECLTLGMIARVEHVKGHDLALRALALLRGRVSARLVFVGADDTAFAADLRQLIAELKLDDLVEFRGQRSDIAAQLAELDVLVAPSRREALSLSLMEACSASLPIIASRIGGNPEIVVDGDNGLLVPSEDPPALAEAILKLAQDTALRQAMRRRARDRYEQNFTLQAMAHGTVAVYERALLDARARSS